MAPSVILSAISYDPIVHLVFGPLRLSPHGIGIAVGFLAGARLMVPAAERRGISEDDVYSLLIRAAVGAIIGARLAYVLNHFGDYTNPLDILRIWEGGISLLGGIFGAIALALPRMKRLGLSFWKVMDAAAPGMALGIIIGRIGDLIVADHLGKVTTFPLGYRCPPIDVPTASPCADTAIAQRTVGALVHQTALYDLLLTIGLLGLLLLLRKKPRYDGFLIFVFAAWYATGRIIEDFLREDVRRFGLTGSQWTAVLSVLAALYALTLLRRTPRWGRWDEEREYVPGEDSFGIDDDTGGAPAGMSLGARDDRVDGDDPDDGDEPLRRGTPPEGPTVTAPDPAQREE